MSLTIILKVALIYPTDILKAYNLNNYLFILTLTLTFTLYMTGAKCTNSCSILEKQTITDEINLHRTQVI